ncbi:MAG: hypothetical protein Q9219_002518 [cf. Caloplaca sp. 3 TL-2023]
MGFASQIPAHHDPSRYPNSKYIERSEQSSLPSLPPHVGDESSHLKTRHKRAFPRHQPNPPITHPRNHKTAPSLSRRGRGGSESLPSIPGISKSPSYDLSRRKFRNLTIIVPALTAAMYIEDFLSVIALRIETGFWADEAPSHHRVIRMWDFELSFHCLTGSVLPWEMIQDYVLGMTEYVSRGFTATYEEHLLGTIDGVAALVKVGFRMLRDPPIGM